MTEQALSEALQLAIHHHQSGRLAEAGALYRQILADHPRCADAVHLLGVIAHQRGQHRQAVDLITAAATLTPGNPAVHCNLGEALRHLNRLDEAIASFRRALALSPGYVEALSNLGNALVSRNQGAEAVGCFQQAIALRPNFPNAYNNLGTALEQLGQLDAACCAYQKAVALQENFAEAHNNLGTVYKARGELEEAIACYQRAVRQRPQSAEFHSNLMLALLCLSGDKPRLITLALSEWSQRHAAPPARVVDSAGPRDRSPDRRLRIGYVSPDFRSHPVGHFLLPLFAAHDQGAVELFCYSNNKHADELTARFQMLADGWRDIRPLSDATAAQIIRDDHIDILVDLALHTTQNRLPLFAHKPAPIQATYLAYAGSSGLPGIDYRLTDPFLEPADGTFAGPEEPLRLPETYWCYQPLVRPAPEVSPLPASKNGYVTFASLNHFSKVTPAVLGTWLRLLVTVPESRLLLHAPAGCTRARLHALAAAHGIDERRIFFSDRATPARYLELYQAVDIALDPFPYPGGATTCDALWMGVPVVSLAGPTPLSRSGYSLLSNVGLPQLVSWSPDEYVAIAGALARDLPRLDALRTGLRQRVQQSPLMNLPRFARNIEAAYRQIWRRWCEGPSVAPNR